MRKFPSVFSLGGGGKDPNNLGAFLDYAALVASYPVGSAGNFAILDSTDTVWVWDAIGGVWHDSGGSGMVTSVNGKVGVVVLAASDVGAVPSTRTVNGKALSADITLASADTGSVPTTTTVNGKALSGNISLTASDVGALPTGTTVDDAKTLQGRTLINTAPSDGQAIAWNNAQSRWEPQTVNGVTAFQNYSIFLSIMNRI